jgi:hypothetical protein
VLQKVGDLEMAKGDMVFLEYMPEPAELSWKDLSYRVKAGTPPQPKTVIQKSSGTFKPGDSVALMGPSGAGASSSLPASMAYNSRSPLFFPVLMILSNLLLPQLRPVNWFLGTRTRFLLAFSHSLSPIHRRSDEPRGRCFTANKSIDWKEGSPV